MTLFVIIIPIFIILISAITNFLHYIACVPIKTYLQTSGWKKKSDNKIIIQMDRGELFVVLSVCEGMDYFTMYYGGCVHVEAIGSEMVGKYPTSSKNIGKTYSKLEAKVKNKVILTYSKLNAIKQIQPPLPPI